MMLSLMFSMIVLTSEWTGLSGIEEAGAVDSDGAEIESGKCAGVENRELVA